MAKQIECSELAWEISTTDTAASRSAPNRRSAIPGTPIMPLPSRFIKAMSSIVASPLTGAVRPELMWILVPGSSGENVFRM